MNKYKIQWETGFGIDRAYIEANTLEEAEAEAKKASDRALKELEHYTASFVRKIDPNVNYFYVFDPKRPDDKVLVKAGSFKEAEEEKRRRGLNDYRIRLAYDFELE